MSFSITSTTSTTFTCTNVSVNRCTIADNAHEGFGHVTIANGAIVTFTDCQFINTSANIVATNGSFWLAHGHVNLTKQQAQQLSRAQKRAQRLLERNLSTEQLSALARQRSFIVRGSKTHKAYRIYADKGYSVNIAELTLDGAVERRLCANLGASNIPLYDHLLAQKLMLEHCEEEFLNIARDHGRELALAA